jgi:hypothetical protein
MYRTLAAAVGVMALNLFTALAQGSGTTLDGVYTTGQAARGQDAYREHCMRCHEGNDQDGPDLKGSGFVDRWRSDTLNVLFTQITTNMPGNRPGGLDERTYVDVLAFLLSANGLPAGGKELTTDVIRSVQLVGKEGQEPLPSMTPVRLVGCVAPGPGGTWMLTNASEPVRSGNINAATSEELQALTASPLGTHTFRLQNVADRAAAMTGHKVQAKGVLIRQYMNDRINVTSLETVASTCP